MIRRTRTAKVYKEPDISDLSFTQTESGAEDSDEWCPSDLKVPTRKAKAEPVKKKPPVKKPAKPKVPKEPKPRAPRKPRAAKALPGPKATDIQKEPNPPEVEKHGETSQTDPSLESQQACQVKEERLSFALPAGPSSEPTAGGEGSSSSRQSLGLKKEEPVEDFTFDEPSLKRQKTDGAPQGRPSRQPYSGRGLREEFNMNWDPVELLSERSGVEPWVCVNVSQLLKEENTVPFMVRYRKDLINHLDADAVRDIQIVLEEIRALAKKTQSISQSLKKEGVLTAGLEMALRNCRAAEELDHVYAPYKKDSGLTKARRAKELGLEPAALELLNTPHSVDLNSWVRPGTKGLSTVEEVATGVEQILADMIAKDSETLKFIRSLCDNSLVLLQSSVSKTALKEQQALGKQGLGRGRGQGVGPGQQSAPKGKPKDIDNFHLYHDFTCNIKSIQHHQTLAINRGENLKILTVKVNISDRVKSNFCRWCLNIRWKPKNFAKPELMKILEDAVEDSYKRLLVPLLTRSYRSKLTAGAEKESIAMFVRNLRQRLLVCPVRGRVLLGVDPGFRHGCKLAVLSPTSQILHTDVVYLHTQDHHREAEKLRSLLLNYSCSTVIIGNGTACRETEAFFADLISRRFFHPLDVSYCITNEAGASIYSVSAEAVKEMPDLDPNLRSAVSIGRRVQDPLAELVKIDPKHIGIGTYQAAPHPQTPTLCRSR
ncbi:S1 RNA-binding domain-containing protein 1 [Osmerus mordax]|uniref:S1 RNA-binding domain-containing protein 1 n=1 Tax=Osmerus mordax TaxID=8014 RepID=UPI00350F4EF2